MQFTNPAWPAALKAVVDQVKDGLGLPEESAVQANLYKLLLYEVGGHFKVHRDSEKEPGL